MNDTKETIDVIGAGPAGLVAAINLAKSGFAVTLQEAGPSVGHRFHGDFQGIENWTAEHDVREILKRINVDVNFSFESYRGGVFFSPSLERRELRTSEPLFYLVERRGGMFGFRPIAASGSCGSEGHVNARSWNLGHGGIIAVGPRAADVTAKG
jgi:choline dehydrogenase-like flavoprotein